MSDPKTIACYVVSTHWDREWYEPFQHFRFHLVELLDEVFDLMAADHRFTCFQLDGQSIPLEDYLEIRPERLEQVRDFARAGRLRLGPWYTMPDEFIVSAESLIRNLEEGIRVAAEFGNISRAGFICDIFGHISQLPQIFRGFGIASAFLFRGVNEATERGSFRWIGADNSELVTHRFGPDEGYFDFTAKVRGAIDQSGRLDLNEAIARLSDYVDVQRDRSGLDLCLLFDGGDHMPIEPQTVALLDGLRAVRPDVEVRHVGLDEYAAELIARRESITRVRRGELRDPGKDNSGTWLIPGVLSSRIRLKQDNRARESELTQWVEPFSVIARRCAAEPYPHTYIRRSWRYLLENHAHDSICGCSPDQVHKDMEYRFDQSRLINTKTRDHALQAVASRVQLPDLNTGEFAMVVFNPTQTPVDGPVDLDLWFPRDIDTLYAEFFHFEHKVGFRLHNADGDEIPYDYCGHDLERRRFHRPHRKAPDGETCRVVRVCAPLRIPALGYTTITVRPLRERTRHPDGRLAPNLHTLENEILRVEVVGPALRILDKRIGQRYDRALIFEERADIGDGWFHGIAVADRIQTSIAAPCDVALLTNGGQKATLRLTHRMNVPKDFLFGSTMRRNPEQTPLIIETDVTLRRGADVIEFRTVIDNQARDHRIRVCFDSGAAADAYLASSAFDVVERPIALPADNHTYKELAVETAPHAGWMGVSDPQRGLAIVAPALPECTVRDTPERTLALTLLRGFRRTVFTDGEDGGQSLGLHEFHYAVTPTSGLEDVSRLERLARLHQAGTRAVQVLPRDQQPAAIRQLPLSYSLLSLTPGDCIVTSLRQRPNSETIELRLYNPHREPRSESIKPNFEFGYVALCDMEGNVVNEPPADSTDAIQLDLPPKAIMTILFTQT